MARRDRTRTKPGHTCQDESEADEEDECSCQFGLTWVDSTVFRDESKYGDQTGQDARNNEQRWNNSSPGHVLKMSPEGNVSSG